ncbi:MAG: histidine phosphatase family protein [Eubacterium sp.]|nr:histidine phosphatase family protein [Eubacterium sp.]
MRLILIRHGEPDYVKDCLTEVGKRQAANTAIRLKRENIKKIYASPMGRAVETASYTAEALGLPIEKLDFMHEIGWGSPEDMTIEDEAMRATIKEGHPWTISDLLYSQPNLEENLINWRQHPYFKNNECIKYYDMISEKLDEFLAEQGFERQDNVQNSLYNGQYICTRKNSDTIALFYHGGSGACALSHMLNLSFPYVLSMMPYGLCSVTTIEFPDNVGQVSINRIELFNDMLHVYEGESQKLYFEK